MTVTLRLRYAASFFAAVAASATFVLIAGGDHLRAFELVALALFASSGAILLMLVSPAWTLSIALAVTVFSSYWPQMGIPVAVDRVVLALAAISVIVREWRAGRRVRSEPIHWLLAVTALYAVASAVAAGTATQHESLFGLIDRVGIVPYLVFFIAPFAVRDEHDRRIVLGVLVALGAYLGLTALFETIGPKALVVPHYISNPALGIQADRARGPFLESSENGLALFACAVVASIAVITWRRRAWRFVAAAVVGLCVVGVLFSLTRAPWIAAVAGTVIAMSSRSQTRRMLDTVLLVAVAAVGLSLLLVPGLSHKVTARANDNESIWARTDSDAAAFRMIAHRPLFGFGWGRFGTDSLAYYRQAPDHPLNPVSDLHDVYISDAVELGLVGATLWLVALLSAIGGSILRRAPPELLPWRVGLGAFAISWLVVATAVPMAYPFPTLLMWAWAGWVRGTAPAGATRRVFRRLPAAAAVRA